MAKFKPEADPLIFSAGLMVLLILRHAFVIHPFAKDIQGARVLDLASHDGRWPYAFAGAGAREVIGIEGWPELVAKFADYPEDTSKDINSAAHFSTIRR